MVVLPPRVSLERRRAVGLPDVPGVLVHAVETGGIADDAGMRKGDLIVAIENVAIDSQSTLRKMLNKPGPAMKSFSILRGAEALEIKLSATST
jgi:S1-C subfamily serine protease